MRCRSRVFVTDRVPLDRIGDDTFSALRADLAQRKVLVRL